METKHIHFRDHILFFTLIPLIILISIFSYYRFFVSHDYAIKYEADCDPVTEECFVGCEDDECTQEYYYFYVQKYAADLYQQCGKDITDCESANICLPSDQRCSVTYCNTETDGDICEMITKEQDMQDTDEEDTEEFLLENNPNENI